MPSSSSSAICTTWSELTLDERLLEAIKRLKWKAPTPVQGACIPLALKGRDLAIQSRTGSGKTGAFLVPILQRVITEQERLCNRRAVQNPVGLVLLPSEELCEQTVEVANALSRYIKPRVTVNNLTSRDSITKARLASAPILVATAAALGKMCRNGTVTAEDMRPLRCVVIDEADLMMSIAESSLRTVQSLIPPSTQTILASATLTDEVAHIKGQLLHNPVTITLDNEEDGSSPAGGDNTENIVLETRVTVRGGDSKGGKLSHHYLVATDECHRHTLLYALFRLGHIDGKTLIFVNSEDSTYKLQSFLAQLGIESLVYDSSLPMNVRLNALHSFQTGTVGALICTDGTLENMDRLRDGAEVVSESQAGEVGQGMARGKSVTYNLKNAGTLHRGIDFSDVNNVILFDGFSAPTTSAFSRYTHRAGRAGRGGKDGIVITIFSLYQAKNVTRPLRDYLGGTHDTFTAFKQMQRSQAAKLQYRVDNVLASITRSSTRRQRVAAVATELTRSAYLKSHMSEKDGTVLKRILSRSKGSTKCDTAVVDVPHYMRIQGADSVRSYCKRVGARNVPERARQHGSQRGNAPEIR
ncbi:putative ATP-dependent RNA helicase [Trypanosoma vivax]|nr:putative ATP-dependent RNA helicase [Trypanosoma vivax]